MCCSAEAAAAIRYRYNIRRNNGSIIPSAAGTVRSSTKAHRLINTVRALHHPVWRISYLQRRHLGKSVAQSITRVLHPGPGRGKAPHPLASGHCFPNNRCIERLVVQILALVFARNQAAVPAMVLAASTIRHYLYFGV